MTEQTTTAIIQISPDQDDKVIGLWTQSIALLDFAKARVITTEDDLKPATDDLSLITKTLKAIETKRAEYSGPIRLYLNDVNEQFKKFTAPLEEANKITRDKIQVYRAEVQCKIAELQAIEAKRLELARMEAAAHDGEHTQDLTPIEKPLPPPIRVSTDAGSARVVGIRKFEIVDFKLLPDELKLPDMVKIGKLVRAGIGAIAGVRIFSEESLRINTK